jgi:multicomponent K+:H+ antiporter subunit C
MDLSVSLAIGVLTGCGVWLLCKARTFEVVLGLTLWSYAVNLQIFAMGRLKTHAAPIVQAGVDPSAYADPLPQALVLTAIVIGFAMTALVVVLALRTHGRNGSDHVDAAEPRP